MRLIGLAVILALNLTLAPLAAGTQHPAKIPSIGYISGGSDSANQAAFREGLRELGYIEGRNILIEYRFAHGSYERLPGFAAEMVESGWGFNS